jgi:hypothetical protein
MDKENIKNADSNEILDKINKLPLLNYNFIDNKHYEGKTVYGLIAKDVKKILPEAITITSQYIPNIYTNANSTVLYNNNVIITVNYIIEIKIDETLKIIVNDIPFYVNIFDFTKDTITVTRWNNYRESDDVFVYGTLNNDFHTLNQPYLGVLCMGGIQELTKQINQLKIDNIELMKQNNILSQRLDKLEKLLQS